jgi:hypothetical protein
VARETPGAPRGCPVPCDGMQADAPGSWGTDSRRCCARPMLRPPGPRGTPVLRHIRRRGPPSVLLPSRAAPPGTSSFHPRSAFAAPVQAHREVPARHVGQHVGCVLRAAAEADRERAARVGCRGETVRRVRAAIVAREESLGIADTHRPQAIHGHIPDREFANALAAIGRPKHARVDGGGSRIAAPPAGRADPAEDRVDSPCLPILLPEPPWSVLPSTASASRTFCCDSVSHSGASHTPGRAGANAPGVQPTAYSRAVPSRKRCGGGCAP